MSVPFPSTIDYAIEPGSSLQHRPTIVRKSVFDAAYELGVWNSNGTIASWMFDDSYAERNKDREVNMNRKPLKGSRFIEGAMDEVDEVHDFEHRTLTDTINTTVGSLSPSSILISEPTVSTRKATNKFKSKRRAIPSDNSRIHLMNTGYESDGYISTKARALFRWNQSNSSKQVKTKDSNILPSLSRLLKSAREQDYKIDVNYTPASDKLKPKSNSKPLLRLESEHSHATQEYETDDEYLPSISQVGRSKYRQLFEHKPRPTASLDKWVIVPSTPSLHILPLRPSVLKRVSADRDAESHEERPPSSQVDYNDRTERAKLQNDLDLTKISYGPSFPIPRSLFLSRNAKRRNPIPRLPSLIIPYSQSNPNTPLPSPVKGANPPIRPVSLPSTPHILVTSVEPIDGLTSRATPPYLFVTPVNSQTLFSSTGNTASIVPLSNKTDWGRNILDYYYHPSPETSELTYPISSDSSVRLFSASLFSSISSATVPNSRAPISFLLDQPTPSTQRNIDYFHSTEPVKQYVVSVTGERLDLLDMPLGRRYREVCFIGRPVPVR